MSNWPDKAWPAPAKLNLMLRITGRRSDGYHELQTVFQFLDVCDYLHFSPRVDGQIKRVTEIDGVPEDDDLIVRAARMLQKEAGINLGVDIGIEKNLPMGGGLGGGSSDAATVLKVLNQLWDCGVSEERLAEIGLSLGADVPVFLFGYAAWAEGVGEKLEAVDAPESPYLVVIPPCHVSTAEVFSDPELTRDSPAITIRAFLEGDTANDCLPVVRKHYPEVAEAMLFLQQYSQPRLTGTGACVFAEFESKAAAEQAKQNLPEGYNAFVAMGLNRSPLLDEMQ